MMMMMAEPRIEAMVLPDSPGTPFVGLSTPSQENHVGPPAIPELLDTSILLHEMPGTIIENTNNRHELAPPNLGDMDFEIGSLYAGSEMGERRPASWL